MFDWNFRTLFIGLLFVDITSNMGFTEVWYNNNRMCLNLLLLLTHHITIWLTLLSIIFKCPSRRPYIDVESFLVFIFTVYLLNLSLIFIFHSNSSPSLAIYALYLSTNVTNFSQVRLLALTPLYSLTYLAII